MTHPIFSLEAAFGHQLGTLATGSRNKMTTDDESSVVICDACIFNEIDGTRTRNLQRDKLAI